MSVDPQNDNNNDQAYVAEDDYAAAPVKHAISSPNSWSILGSMAKVFSIIISLVIIAAVVGVSAVLWVFWAYGKGLPDYRQLAKYEPPVVTRIHAGNGALLAEYANEKRLFVPIDAIPPQLIHAFISAEDKLDNKAFFSTPNLYLAII